MAATSAVYACGSSEEGKHAHASRAARSQSWTPPALLDSIHLCCESISQKLWLREPSGGTGEAQQVGLALGRCTHPFKLLEVDQEHEDSEAEGVVHDCRALELAERDRDRRLGLLERKAVRREQL